MSSPAPLLRPPIPGSSRSNGGARTPRLGLAIPPSPSQKPVMGNSNLPDLPQLRTSTRPAPPQLRLATPKGSNTTPQDMGPPNGRPPLQFPTGNTMGGYDEFSANSRSGSIGLLDGRGSGPTSASSSAHSALSFGNGLRQPGGTPDPASAISSIYSDRGPHEGGTLMERESSNSIAIDLDKLSLELGRDPDVDDLDDDGWFAASKGKRIIELGTLGEGAGGAVTRCKLQGGKTVFALKIITTDPDPDVQKQIRRELDFNRKIAAEHICRYYGAFGDPSTGMISIAMEYCEGGSLDSVYREVKKLGGRIGEKVLGKIAEGVLNGLTYLYGKKIIHRGMSHHFPSQFPLPSPSSQSQSQTFPPHAQSPNSHFTPPVDIKPSNILLCRNGQVKLCDFGVSGEFGTRGDANTFIGTSYYMAPERITGQSYTITSDVWSLGVTLLEVAQHRFPFPADGTEMQPRAGLIDIIQYIVGQPLPKLKDEPACGNEPEIKWSANFKYFIECCLEKEPARRATPWRMLEHPWMVEMKGKKVSMEKFLQQVWDWKD
ncbi:Protein kinase C signaling pathway involved MAPKK protein [Xylographa soralifera]|nr:Protein kinase C signaling pathway involved MAPKK protein [Xylographa soralifera]